MIETGNGADHDLLSSVLSALFIFMVVSAMLLVVPVGRVKHNDGRCTIIHSKLDWRCCFHRYSLL